MIEWLEWGAYELSIESLSGADWLGDCGAISGNDEPFKAYYHVIVIDERLTSGLCTFPVAAISALLRSASLHWAVLGPPSASVRPFFSPPFNFGPF